MKRTAYISLAYRQRAALAETIDAIGETLLAWSIDPFVFVDVYTFHPSEERCMMAQAMADIDRCNLLVAETSEKAIGVGVEVGYAKAKGKPVVYLRKSTAEHATTASGISDFQVVYESTSDLRQQLAGVLVRIVELQQL